MMRTPFYLLVSLWLIMEVAWADTEIRNFQLPLSAALQPTKNIPSLSLDAATRQLELNVSNHHPFLDVLLVGDDVHKHWTARISWPASMPTRFNMTLLPPPQPHVDGVILRIESAALTPRYVHPPWISSLFPSSTGPKDWQVENEIDGGYETTFHLVFEPLVYGFIPQTSVSLIGWLVLVGGIAASLCPFLIRFIEKFAQDQASPTSSIDTKKTK